MADETSYGPSLVPVERANIHLIGLSRKILIDGNLLRTRFVRRFAD